MPYWRVEKEELRIQVLDEENFLPLFYITAPEDGILHNPTGWWHGIWNM